MHRSPQRARTLISARARRRLIGSSLVLWLCLFGESPESRALRGVRGARAQTATTGAQAQVEPGVDPRCAVEQKKPLFVGFAAGMTLDAFEPAALASREIWRAAKHWLCDVRTPVGAPHGLTRALAQHAALRGDEVRFDDEHFQHAHVVLVDASQTQRAWHVHLANGGEAWHVTHATESKLGAERP